jgi:hypothetical protein
MFTADARERMASLAARMSGWVGCLAVMLGPTLAYLLT